MTVGFQTRLLSEKPQTRRRNVFEGVTKNIFEGIEPDTFILYFKDNHPLNTADKQGYAELSGKGVINNRFSEMIYSRLSELNVEHHLVRRLNMREQIVKIAENLPFYVDVHNKACDDFIDRFGLEQYDQLPEMIAELRFKNKKAGNPIVSSQHLVSFGLSDHEELDQLFATIQRINDFLLGQFSAVDLSLMQYKLEFGRVYLSENLMDTRLILIDEISLDTCRVLDNKTKKRLDVYDAKNEIVTNVFGYHEIARRFGILPDQSALLAVDSSCKSSEDVNGLNDKCEDMVEIHQ
jgi:phosphoribosylaminoimidazole-succinocarboxamide synthase